ncbi:MAG: hypothetical protein BRD55_04785 [Bacteroidetes bacterium SW_9_63_38]|nr:MAG: hypothetical protein BRD55_04785 [Bacteroidetes bacterium SW_9_63_38]
MNDLVSPVALNNLVNGIEEEAVGKDPGPIACTVGEGFDHDPPRSFQTEEAREYFDEREAEPTLVIFAPVPEEKRKE